MSEYLFRRNIQKLATVAMFCSVMFCNGIKYPFVSKIKSWALCTGPFAHSTIKRLNDIMFICPKKDIELAVIRKDLQL